MFYLQKKLYLSCSSKSEFLDSLTSLFDLHILPIFHPFLTLQTLQLDLWTDTIWVEMPRIVIWPNTEYSVTLIGRTPNIQQPWNFSWVYLIKFYILQNNRIQKQILNWIEFYWVFKVRLHFISYSNNSFYCTEVAIRYCIIVFEQQQHLEGATTKCLMARVTVLFHGCQSDHQTP